MWEIARHLDFFASVIDQSDEDVPCMVAIILTGEDNETLYPILENHAFTDIATESEQSINQTAQAPWSSS